MPLVYRALLAAPRPGPRHPRHPPRPGRRPAGRRPPGSWPNRPRPARHRTPAATVPTTDLDEALRGADFVFSAIRVGGLEGRAADERVALDHGVLGQETVGAGGIAYGLRTVPVRRRHRPARRPPGPRRLGHQLHQPRGPGHRGHVPPPRRPGHRHLRLAGGPRPPRRPRARRRSGPRVDRLRRPEPPRLAARPARRRARRTAASAGRPRGPRLVRGGQALRPRVAAPPSARSPTSICTTTTSTGKRYGLSARPSRPAAPSSATSRRGSTR
ncbi:hypothetical protein SANTM175S_07893 [Streptomyces antimycoticus]